MKQNTAQDLPTPDEQGSKLQTLHATLQLKPQSSSSATTASTPNRQPFKRNQGMCQITPPCQVYCGPLGTQFFREEAETPKSNSQNKTSFDM